MEFSEFLLLIATHTPLTVNSKIENFKRLLPKQLSRLDVFTLQIMGIIVFASWHMKSFVKLLDLIPNLSTRKRRIFSR